MRGRYEQAENENMNRKSELLNEIEQHVEDAENVWKEWLSCGFDDSKPLKVDFNLYCSSKNKLNKICLLYTSPSPRDS